MVLNNRGQLFFYTLMLAVVIIVLALSLVVVVKQFAESARAPTQDDAVGLDCNNSTISDFQQAQCIITDLATPYFLFGFIAIAGMVIGAKLLIDNGVGQ